MSEHDKSADRNTISFSDFGKATFGIGLLLFSASCQNANTAGAPSSHSDPLRPSPTQLSLKDQIVQDAAERMKVQPSSLSSFPGFYHQDTFPFPGGYQTGGYQLVSDKPKEEKGSTFICFYDNRGEYIGVVRPNVEKGRGYYISEKHDGTKTYYQKTQSDIFAVEYMDGKPGEDSSFQRTYVEHPVVRITGTTSTKEKPYTGTFGGDSEHVLKEYGPGIFYVVHSERHAPNGKIASSEGELFVMNPSEFRSPSYEQCSTRVTYKDGRFFLEENPTETDQKIWRNLPLKLRGQ